MTPIRKLHDIDSSDKKIWALLKSFLFFFSLAFLVCWGYIKSNSENPVTNKSVDPDEQSISGENQKNDSTYYAFSRILGEYSQDKK